HRIHQVELIPDNHALDQEDEPDHAQESPRQPRPKCREHPHGLALTPSKPAWPIPHVPIAVTGSRASRPCKYHRSRSSKLEVDELLSAEFSAQDEGIEDGGVGETTDIPGRAED